MAGSLSNNAENLVLTWLFSGTAATRPSSWYVGLFTDATGLSSDQPSTEATTGTCPGYARQQITSFTISGTNPTQAVNNQAATFTATGAWSTVNYFGIWDASSGGNLVTWGTITSKTLANTDQLTFPATTGLTITID
jgi:hypothetical protein